MKAVAPYRRPISATKVGELLKRHGGDDVGDIGRVDADIGGEIHVGDAVLDDRRSPLARARRHRRRARRGSADWPPAPALARTIVPSALAEHQPPHQDRGSSRAAPPLPARSRAPRSSPAAAPPAKRAQAAGPRSRATRPSTTSEAPSNLSRTSCSIPSRISTVRPFRSSKVFRALAKSAIVSTMAVAASTRPPMVSASSVRMRIGAMRHANPAGGISASGHVARTAGAASIGVAVGADLADVDALPLSSTPSAKTARKRKRQ